MSKLQKRLTIPWAQSIVDQHAYGTTVSGVNILAIDVGTTTRVRLDIKHDGPSSLPHRWFVKLPSQLQRVKIITALPQLLQTEARFYQKLIHSVPVNCPDVLAIQHSWRQGTLLALADITETGAVPGFPTDALTPDQATLVIEQLAHLHAYFWNARNLGAAKDWLSGSMRRWEDRIGNFLSVPLMRLGLFRAGEIVPKTLHVPALRYAIQRRKAVQFLSNAPHTLVHHDLHPGNFFWRDSKPGFLDWQLVRTGEGISDVAYFLATALTPEVRRKHELKLLIRYRDAILRQGIVIQDNEALLQRYRAHLVYPFEAMIVTLAVGGMMDLKANLELISRVTAAIEDHDTFTCFS